MKGRDFRTGRLMGWRCHNGSVFDQLPIVFLWKEARNAMLLEANHSQLVLVDYQEKLMPAIFEGAAVLERALRLARVAQLLDVPIIGTEQNPAKLGANAQALRSLCATTVTKTHFSAVPDGLIDVLMPPKKASPTRGGNARSLPKHLQKTAPAAVAEPERSSIVIAGCEAHVCLLQTALELIESEAFDVWVVTDACSSRTVRDRDAAFDRLAAAGAELVTMEMVAFEWLRDCAHPRFKDVLALIK